MKRRFDSPGRAALKRLCTLLGFVLAVMLSITLLTQNLMRQGGFGRIRDISLSSLDFSKFDLSEVFSPLKSQTIGGFGSDIVNVLLVGQDGREGDETARSDSMILCTYNRESKKLILTSFLRDLYVPIPGHGSNRINAAYAMGGTPLLEKTLEHNFGVHIDGGVEVDFSQFSGIIDLLGGVEIDLRQDEANFLNKELGCDLREGTQQLTGEQALLYARIRSLDADGDFSRTDRQRKVLSALVDHCRGAGMKELVSLVDALLPLIDTDMSKVQILTLAVELLPNLSSLEISSQSVPAPGSCTDETIDGMAVLKADPEAVRKVLEETLLN